MKNPVLVAPTLGVIGLVLLALSPGCSKKKRACNSYAEMEVECGNYSEDGEEEARDYAKDECLAAWDAPEGYDSITNQIVAASKCATKSPTCADYQTCKERSR